MANDAFALSYAPPRAVSGGALGTIAFVGLLLMVFVGLEPFVPPAAVAAFGGVTRGDAWRQISYILIFSLILLSAFHARGFAALRAVPWTVALLLLWCLLSADWAAEPSVVLRRAGLEVVIVLSAFLSVETLGAERAFRIWRWLLAAILLVNWLSIPLVETARHLSGDADAGLTGDWRGLYGHKNIAGAVCVMTAMLFVFTRNGRGNWIGILIALASLGFLVMTRSKSSLGFLPLALLAGAAYRFGWRDGFSRAIVTTLALLLLSILAIAAMLYAPAIAHVLEDPTEFTGRAAIWQAEVAYIGDHPLLGAGYGTFADTGGLSPLHFYIHDVWVEGVSHGHNGYLQMLVTIGCVGFALAIAGLVLTPLVRFWPLDRGRDAFKPLLFGLFVFLILHNVMELDFLEEDSVAWVALLLVIAALAQTGSARPDKSLTGPL